MNEYKMINKGKEMVKIAEIKNRTHHLMRPVLKKLGFPQRAALVRLGVQQIVGRNVIEPA